MADNLGMAHHELVKRSFIIFAGLVFSFLALHEIYTAK